MSLAADMGTLILRNFPCTQAQTALTPQTLLRCAALVAVRPMPVLGGDSLKHLASKHPSRPQDLNAESRSNARIGKF